MGVNLVADAATLSCLRITGTLQTIVGQATGSGPALDDEKLDKVPESKYCCGWVLLYFVHVGSPRSRNAFAVSCSCSFDGTSETCVAQFWPNHRFFSHCVNHTFQALPAQLAVVTNVGDLEALMVPADYAKKLEANIPKEFDGLPRLLGRASVSARHKKGAHEQALSSCRAASVCHSGKLW